MIRADVTYADVGFITFSLLLVLGETETRMPGFWRRHLQLCLDGPRAPLGDLPERARLDSTPSRMLVFLTEIIRVEFLVEAPGDHPLGFAAQ